MTEHEARRTLVKSAPELWAECSDAASLARHLGQFGEIRITRLEPETAVAWEGEHVSGTVRLEPSGWGTRVILTASAGGPVAGAAAAVPPAASAARRPVALEQQPRDGFFARLRRTFGGGRAAPRPERTAIAEAPEGHVAVATAPADPAVVAVVVADAVPDTVADVDAGPAPEFEPEPGAAPSPERVVDSAPEIDAAAVLTAALDSLGQAHHRPFSRA